MHVFACDMHHKGVIVLVVWCSIALSSYSQMDEEIKISNCPGTLTDTAHHNETAAIMWTAPNASHLNVPISNVILKSTPPLTGDPPYHFPIGQHLITYTFTSTSGKQMDCTFSVIIFERVEMLETPPKNVFLPTEKFFHFPCYATSSSGIRYMWTKDDVELKQSDRIQWSEDRPGLVIKNTVVEDSGTYTCTAFAANNEGAVRSTSVSSVLGISENIAWTQWSEWSVCFSCTEGTRMRQRSCKTPEGNIALLGCEGLATSTQNCTEACPTDAPKVRIETKFSDTIFGKMAYLSVICFVGAAFSCGGCLIFGIILDKKKKRNKHKKKAKLAELEKSMSADASDNEATAMIDNENEVNRNEMEQTFEDNQEQSHMNYDQSYFNYEYGHDGYSDYPTGDGYEQNSYNYGHHEMSYAEGYDDGAGEGQDSFAESIARGRAALMNNRCSTNSENIEEALVMAQATAPQDAQLRTAQVKQMKDWKPSYDP